MTGTEKSAKPALRAVPLPRPWDARAARWLVTPLVPTRVTPNHLTTLRLLIGVAGAFYLARGADQVLPLLSPVVSRVKQTVT